MSVTLNELKLSNVMNSTGPALWTSPETVLQWKAAFMWHSVFWKGSALFLSSEDSVQKQALCVDKRHDCPFDCALETQNGWRETFCALLDIVNKRERKIGREKVIKSTTNKRAEL